MSLLVFFYFVSAVRLRWLPMHVKSLRVIIVAHCFVRTLLVLLTDTPGKAGTPTIEDVDEDSVKLSWTPPKTDGGDKIRGYVIEAKEKGSNKWKPLNAKSPCKDTKFTGTYS